MIPKLTDFSREELQTLLAAVSHYMVDQENHTEHYEKMHLQKMPGFNRMYSYAKMERDNCKLWAIQIMTALQEVNDIERVNSN
jgi:hypothetical protein